MDQLTLVDPTATEAPQAIGSLAPRRPLGAGAVVALLGNGKPRALDLLEMVAARVAEGAGIDAVVEVHAKASAAKPLTPEEAAAVAERATIAVAAIGDCGACSACTVDDSAQLERLGVPTTAIVTEPFQSLASRFAVRAGMPGLAVAVVPHPVASRDDEVLGTYARTVADHILAQLPGSDPTPTLVPAAPKED